MTDLRTLAPRLDPGPFRDGTVRDAAAFRARLERFKQYVELKHHRTLKAILIEVFTELVKANPVGEPSRWKRPRKGYVGGHSSRNWQISIRPTVSEKPGAGSANQDMTDGIAAAQAIPIAVKKAFIVNPVDYMEQLNRGWSKQAPAGWIDAILNRVLAKYRRVQ